MNTQLRRNQPTDSQILGAMIRSYKVAPKMKPVNINDDPILRDHIRHVLKPKEKLGEFFARTGLGRAQALTMSRDEITHFIEQAETARAQEGIPSAAAMAPRCVPAKLFIDEEGR